MTLEAHGSLSLTSSQEISAVSNSERKSDTSASESPTPSGRSLSQQVQSLRLPPPSAGASGLNRLAWLLCFAFAALSGWLSYQRYTLKLPAPELLQAATDAAPQATESPTNEPPVDTAAAAGKFAYESNGYITVAHQILISPQVSGRLVMLDADEGRRVRKGELLGEIEDTEYQAEFNRSQSTLEIAKARLLELERGFRPEEVAQAKAELEEVEAQLVQLQAEWNRTYELRKSNLVSEESFELIDSRLQATQRRRDRLTLAAKLIADGPRDERISAARGEVGQAEADLAKAAWRLSNCKIVAPISGTILKRNAEQGNLVNPVALNGSFSVCDIADLSDLEVSLDVPERDIAKVHVGQRCKVRPDAFKNRVYEGTVSRLMPIANRAKSSITVRVKLTVPSEEEGVYLKPDMSALVSFLNERE